MEEGSDIVYTYDVEWEESDTAWVSRWDAYLKMPGGRVHWFSILNSILVVLVMACIVAMILLRTIRRDLARYEQMLVDAGAWTLYILANVEQPHIYRADAGRRGCADPPPAPRTNPP